jgi:hypothetical protein
MQEQWEAEKTSLNAMREAIKAECNGMQMAIKATEEKIASN